MKKFLLFFVILLNLCSAQLIYKITSDKTNYEYGEFISVNVLLHNNTDSLIQVPLAKYDLLILEFDDHTSYSTPIEIIDHNALGPQERKEWNCLVKPIHTGLPKFSGEHIIKAKVGSFIDSVIVTAPKFHSGLAMVGLDSNYSETEVNKLKDSLNVTVIDRSVSHSLKRITEQWEIRGFDIDSLETVLKNDIRIRSFDVLDGLIFEGSFLNDVKLIDKKVSNFILYQNYPNPFNPSTTIYYDLDESDNVKLTIYNLLGEEILKLVDEYQNNGRYEVSFISGNLPSGVYIYRIESKGKIDSKKMILLK